MPDYLAGSEERFKLLVEAVSDYAIFLLDKNGNIETWNAGAQRFKLYSAEEVIGKHFSIFYTKEDVEREHPNYELAVARATGRFEEEGWRVRKDGTRFWASVVITRLTNTAGEIVGFAKVTRDLTERKLAEEQLKVSEQRYRLLVSAVKDYAIFMLGPDGRVITWNEGAERLKGYKPDEIIGQYFSAFYVPEDIRAKKPQWEIEEATITGRFEDEGWRVRKDGTRFWANVLITAIYDDKRDLIGFSKVTRDVTDRRRLEEKLRRGNEELDERVRERTMQLEQAVKARDEFMGIVSHELRTPVTSLRLQAQVAMRQLKRNDISSFHEKSVKFVSGAERQLDRLSKLIEDMLDVSRISMDRLFLERTPMDLKDLVRETIDRFEDQSSELGCHILFEGEPVEVLGDSHRLEQVFSNLLINAIKYGPGKPIFVSVKRLGAKAAVKIVDQGVGIAPEDQERVFDRFERAVSANEVSGLGLGLYISRKIVEAHNGTLSVESTFGEGSTFTVTFDAV